MMLLLIDLNRVAMAMLVAALLLALIRLMKGPALPDRVVALDLMSTLVTGILGTYAVIADQAVLIDVAIVVALVTFLGTVAFARYLEKRHLRRRGSPHA